MNVKVKLAELLFGMPRATRVTRATPGGKGPWNFRRNGEKMTGKGK